MSYNFRGQEPLQLEFPTNQLTKINATSRSALQYPFLIFWNFSRILENCGVVEMYRYSSALSGFLVLCLASRLSQDILLSQNSSTLSFKEKRGGKESWPKHPPPQVFRIIFILLSSLISYKLKTPRFSTLILLLKSGLII